MKQFLTMVTVFLVTLFSAQDEQTKTTQESNYMVGLNSTSLGFTNVNKNTNVNVGITLGAFVAKDLALVVNTGYQSTHSKNFNSNDWFYGAGAKYYFESVVPFQVDWRGSTGSNINPSTSFVGTQLGYAWFPFKNFSIEPKLRYDFSTKKDYENIFSGGLDFNVFF